MSCGMRGVGNGGILACTEGMVGRAGIKTKGKPSKPHEKKLNEYFNLAAKKRKQEAGNQESATYQHNMSECIIPSITSTIITENILPSCSPRPILPWSLPKGISRECSEILCARRHLAGGCPRHRPAAPRRCSPFSPTSAGQP